tara:strand:+ start:103 stop:216 length:114 start_codon:yes stop_codon:yes gene_type:complete
MEKIKTIINYVKEHEWDYVDAALVGSIALLLLVIIIN